MEAVKTSLYGLVRSCTVGYNVTRQHKEDTRLYRGTWRRLNRSIQWLTLLLPVEEQEGNLTVSDNKVCAAAEEGSDEEPTDGDDEMSSQGTDEVKDRLTEKIKTSSVPNRLANVAESILSPTAEEFVPAHLRREEASKSDFEKTDEQSSSVED